MKMKPLVRGPARRWAVILMLTACCMSATAAEKRPPEKPKPAIELGAPFADNAILQRQMPVPVWGWSKPGAKVTVEFAGQKKSATAGKDGKWMLKLDALEASATPQELVVRDSAGNTVTLKNILVGEVWMASGQSNMQWTAQKSSSSLIIKELVEKAKAERGKLPPIREGKVTNVFSSLHPIEHAEGAWSDGSNFSDYSAIAFAFAYELYKELSIPIGILNCAFSTTAIQAWTPPKGIVFDDPTTVRKGRLKLHEGDIRLTRSKDGKTIYAARLSLPQKPFLVSSFSTTGVGKDVKVGSISLLGSNETIKWGRTESGITITPPARSPFEDRSWPVIFKIETK